MSEPETKSNLNWTRFTAAYYPKRSRHDMQALTAYGTYRRSRFEHERPSGEVQQTAALAAWENEGGPVL